MKDLPIAAALAPILIAQGKWARARTPSLPEATGKRVGCDGEGSPLKLMILGDSAAAGVGVESQQQALCGQLVARLSQLFELEWELVAAKGATTASALSWVPGLKKRTVDVIVVSLGVNDVTSGVTRKQWRRQQQVLVQELESRFAPQQILLTQVPPMEQFKALPQPLRWCVGRQSRRFNVAAKEDWQQHHRCEILEPPFKIDSALMALDQFHPGEPAYEIWADAVVARVKEKFA